MTEETAPSGLERAVLWATDRTRWFVLSGVLVAGIGGAVTAYSDAGKRLGEIWWVSHGYLRSNIVRHLNADELCKNESKQERALRKLNNYEVQLKKTDLDASTRDVYTESASLLKKKLTKLERRHKVLVVDLGLDGDDQDCD